MADIAAAWRRVEGVLRRRPRTGLHADAPARARWNGGTLVTCTHESGAKLVTDMPTELGGDGSAVTPGWLLRAGLAACAATTIAMTAAAEGIELDALEIDASSNSDTRGLFGMSEMDGARVDAGPRDVQLHVRVSARGVAPERLRALIEASHRRAPVSRALENPVPVKLRIDVDVA